MPSTISPRFSVFHFRRSPAACLPEVAARRNRDCYHLPSLPTPPAASPPATTRRSPPRHVMSSARCHHAPGFAPSPLSRYMNILYRHHIPYDTMFMRRRLNMLAKNDEGDRAAVMPIPPTACSSPPPARPCQNIMNSRPLRQRQVVAGNR